MPDLNFFSGSLDLCRGPQTHSSLSLAVTGRTLLERLVGMHDVCLYKHRVSATLDEIPCIPMHESFIPMSILSMGLHVPCTEVMVKIRDR